jgi:S1-C subfamily serine protease
MLQATGDAIAAIAERVGPSVAGLGRGWGRGSGVVVAPNRVLTNAHVLRGPDVAVALGGGTHHGRVAGADPDTDVAVIEVDTGDAPPVGWDPERAAAAGIGTPVFALADPGGRGLRVTHGFVATAPHPVRGPRGRRIAGSLEHTAPLPRGASGGPLVDAEGHLLGLNTVRLEGGFILALPADASMRARVDALARGESTARPRLGVALGRGLLVRAVKDASPAAVAGIVPGDRFVALDDRPLRSSDDLLDALEAGQPFTVTVQRGSEQRDLSVVLQ